MKQHKDPGRTFCAKQQRQTNLDSTLHDAPKSTAPACSVQRIRSCNVLQHQHCLYIVYIRRDMQPSFCYITYYWFGWALASQRVDQFVGKNKQTSNTSIPSRNVPIHNTWSGRQSTCVKLNKRNLYRNMKANISGRLTLHGSELRLNEFLVGARANLIRLRHFAHVYNLHPN